MVWGTHLRLCSFRYELALNDGVIKEVIALRFKRGAALQL